MLFGAVSVVVVVAVVPVDIVARVKEDRGPKVGSIFQNASIDS
jgi:hypothetical protein